MTEKVQEIIEYLFTNSAGQKADRLVLTTKDGKDLGGWSQAAVKAYLLKILEG